MGNAHDLIEQAYFSRTNLDEYNPQRRGILTVCCTPVPILVLLALCQKLAASWQTMLRHAGLSSWSSLYITVGDVFSKKLESKCEDDIEIPYMTHFSF